MPYFFGPEKENLKRNAIAMNSDSIDAESITELSHVTRLKFRVFCGIHKCLVKNKPKMNALFNKKSCSKWFETHLILS